MDSDYVNIVIRFSVRAEYSCVFSNANIILLLGSLYVYQSGGKLDSTIKNSELIDTPFELINRAIRSEMNR